ncbi:MAG TPA: hypothetical protein VGC12_00285 [Methyloradius sp.]
MSRIRLPVTYKQLCILKHAMRDMPYRDADEEVLYGNLTDAVTQFKDNNHIPDRDYRNDLNHEPIKGRYRGMLK